MLVEGFYYVSGFRESKGIRSGQKERRTRGVYKTLKKSGLKQVYYMKGDGMIGNDFEGTVDGLY